jgi:hypothetical protein
MSHPEELLAGYTEGTLEGHERAMVEAHLVGCDVCTEEIELARRARRALAALPEESVPVGVAGPVLAELYQGASGDREPAPVAPIGPRRGGLPAWVPRALAAAAAIVGLGFFGAYLLPDLGGPSEEPAAVSAAQEAGGPAPAGQDINASAPTLEKQNVDYDGASLSELAQEVADDPVGWASRAGDGSGAPALECVRRGSSLTESDHAVRLIEATYEGRGVYIGVFLESPTPGAPATKVVIWIVARDGCGLVSYSQQLIR